MSSVIIFYEILSREYPACDKIRKILEEKHNHKVGVFSIIYEYYKAINFAKKNGVDCVVMPWFKRQENYEDMKPFININKDILICNLNHEQIASDETILTVLPLSNDTKTKCIHFCWGSYYKQLLSQYGVNKEDLIITGNPRMDFGYECKLNREDLAREFNLSLNKKWILFAEARDWGLDECNFKIRVGQGLDENMEKESLYWNNKCLEETYNQLNNFKDDFFEKFEFIYRPHPSCSNPKGITNPNVKVTANYSIYEWLKNCDYYISSASTSAFEAESMGKPVICFEIEDMPKMFKTYGLEEYLQINNLNEIDENLFNKAEKLTKGKNIFKKYIGSSDGSNCENVADVVNELISSGRKIDYQDIDFKENNNTIKRTKEKLKKILMATGLVRLIKSKVWCELSYKDCPFRKTNKKMYGIKNETRK